jgi:hypothetical protein
MLYTLYFHTYYQHGNHSNLCCIFISNSVKPIYYRHNVSENNFINMSLQPVSLILYTYFYSALIVFEHILIGLNLPTIGI